MNTAVVVGVGAELRLGAALCRRFAREGYHVLVAGRTPTKIDQVAGSQFPLPSASDSRSRTSAVSATISRSGLLPTL